jgi:hypothetical protein
MVKILILSVFGSPLEKEITWFWDPFFISLIKLKEIDITLNIVNIYDNKSQLPGLMKKLNIKGEYHQVSNQEVSHPWIATPDFIHAKALDLLFKNAKVEEYDWVLVLENDTYLKKSVMGVLEKAEQFKEELKKPLVFGEVVMEEWTVPRVSPQFMLMSPGVSKMRKRIFEEGVEKMVGRKVENTAIAHTGWFFFQTAIANKHIEVINLTAPVHHFDSATCLYSGYKGGILNPRFKNNRVKNMKRLKIIQEEVISYVNKNSEYTFRDMDSIWKNLDEEGIIYD